MKLHLVTTRRALPALIEQGDAYCTVVFWEWGTLRTETAQLVRIDPPEDEDDESTVVLAMESESEPMSFDRISILLLSEIESITIGT